MGGFLLESMGLGEQPNLSEGKMLLGAGDGSTHICFSVGSLLLSAWQPCRSCRTPQGRHPGSRAAPVAYGTGSHQTSPRTPRGSCSSQRIASGTCRTEMGGEGMGRRWSGAGRERECVRTPTVPYVQRALQCRKCFWRISLV